MSQRMTDEEFEARLMEPSDTREAFSRCYVEAARARAEEAEKDAIIADLVKTIRYMERHMVRPAMADVILTMRDSLIRAGAKPCGECREMVFHKMDCGRGG